MIYGAIIGDIVGSRFEFDIGGKTKQFELFTTESTFTDDSVMTIAVADALLEAGKDATIDAIKDACIKSMQYWGRKYPNAGYGNRFYDWVFSPNPIPYNSYGNGSAMRVSSAGWLYDSLERTLEVARATAEISHNHPEGIKGAECTAGVIYLGRTGHSKKEIEQWVINNYGYDIKGETVDEMRKCHQHIETCMDSLPKALVAFLEGETYEDSVRNAVSLGGDTDTIAAISGAMAEGFFGVSESLREVCLAWLPLELRNIVYTMENILADCTN